MMKKLAIVVAGWAVTMCAVAHAQNSKFNGSWKIVNAKSSWSDGNYPKNMSLAIDLVFNEEQLTYHSVNDTNKDKPASVSFTAGIGGKAFPLSGSPRYNQVTLKKISDNEFELLELKDGDVIVGALWMFSQDGKHLVRWGVGKSPEGKSKAYIEYFDRQ